MYFKIVKTYYDKQIYTDANIATFVKAGKLSADEYKQITGKEYCVKRGR